MAGAPVAHGQARLDDGTDDRQVPAVEGQAFDSTGKALPDAKVEVWHANCRGNHSFFGPTQSSFDLRRTIVTDSEGRYRLHSIVPVGYSVPQGALRTVCSGNWNWSATVHARPTFISSCRPRGIAS